MTHFEQLLRSVPDLRDRSILDLGSGQGGFLLEAAQEGAKVTGIELNPAYIVVAQGRLAQAGYRVDILEGKGEDLPFADASFQFVNMAEVIEHVEDPMHVIAEVRRVLIPAGMVYMSVPNRFGMRDQHFKLYFVNWLPRAWSESYIRLFGKQKRYGDEAGHQKLTDMHYYTFNGIYRLLRKSGFEPKDIRELKIGRIPTPVLRIPALLVYRFLRGFYFDSFHILATKSTEAV